MTIPEIEKLLGKCTPGDWRIGFCGLDPVINSDLGQVAAPNVMLRETEVAANTELFASVKSLARELLSYKQREQQVADSLKDEQAFDGRIVTAIESLIAQRDCYKELAGEWIPYSREDDDDHLCGHVWLVRGYEIDDTEEIMLTLVATYSYHGGWSIGTDHKADFAVTHYMPLPAPPTGAPHAEKG